MKKTIAVTAILSAYFLFLSANGFAQLRTDNRTNPGTETLLTTAEINSMLTHVNANLVSAYAANEKALRDFKKNFKDVKDVSWYNLSNGYAAEFTDKDIKSSVLYNKAGRWQYTIRRYGERDLPVDVRSLVKSQYYDCSITGIDEVRVDQKIIYLVHMEDENTWKNVRVCDGEISLIENYDKD